MRVSDEILKEAIHKAAKGDENASKIIYENFAMYVLTICRRYGIQSDLLKDYLQDIFSECFQSIHRFDRPKQFSVIFNLFVIDGYSAKEISQMLDINEGTIRSYVTRGREWARQNLKHLHPEKN